MSDEVRADEEQVEETNELEALQQERDDLLDTLQRVQAEFDNYRKRAARDQQSLVVRAHERLVQELLPVLDDLERALEAAEAHEEAKLEEGVALVARSFAEVLRKEGLEEVPTDRQVRPACPRGTALAALGGDRGQRDRGAAEGLPARGPGDPSGSRGDC